MCRSEKLSQIPGELRVENMGPSSTKIALIFCLNISSNKAVLLDSFSGKFSAVICRGKRLYFRLYFRHSYTCRYARIF